MDGRWYTKMILAGALLTLAAPAAAQVAPPGTGYNARTIRVTGVGEFRAQPDLATLQFAVETTGTTAEEASVENAARMERVIAALVAEGIARGEIQTSGYSLFPEYVEQRGPGIEQGPPRIRGYRALNQVSVRTRAMQEIGALIDAGLAAGANRLNGVSFTIDDAGAAESEALSLAVADGRRAAETMAQALGVRLGQILDASTSSQPIQPFYREMAQDMRMEMAAATPIEPGEQTVRATASLVFAID